MTPSTAGGVFLKALSGSIGANRELLSSDAEIGGARDVVDAYLGPVSYSGEFEFYARMRALAILLKGALGDVDSTGSTTGTRGTDQLGVHVITPAETLPWLSVEEAIGTNLEAFEYTDCMVNSISLEASPDGYFMGTAGLVGVKQVAGITKTASPDVDTTPLMVGTSMTILINDTAIGTYAGCPRDFSLDFTNNIEDDVFCLGSVTLSDLTPKRRELDLSMTIRPENNDLWREAVYGGSAETQPLSGAAATVDLKINITTYENLGTGAPANVPFEFDLHIPKCNIEPFAIEPSGDDVIEYDVSFKAIKPDTAVPLCTVTITNDEDTVG